MIGKHDLQRWIDILHAQIVAFDAAYLVVTGEPHVANVTLVAFLKMNDAIVKESVELAVNEFAKTKKWPALNGDQLVNLYHRASVARDFLLLILREQIPNAAALRMLIPNAADRQKFVRWLFVDAWNCFGSTYLDALTNTYLAEHR